MIQVQNQDLTNIVLIYSKKEEKNKEEFAHR